MSLKDYRTDLSDLPREGPDTSTPSPLSRKNQNAQKISSLSTRVTIMTILLPICMGVVLVFLYLDMKDRVMDVDSAKGTQVDYLSRQMEDKLNALDIRIAKNRFDLDEKLPVLEQKSGSLERQLGSLAASKADINALDAGLTQLENQLARQDRRIQNNADQNQANLAELERINSTLLSELTRNREQVEKSVQTLKQEMTSLQARMDENQVDLQPLQNAVSLLENQIMSRTEITRRLMSLKTDVDRSLRNLEKQMKTHPLTIPDSISEETLTQ